MRQVTVHNMVLDGPGNFDASDISTLLGTVANVIDLLTRTACDGFFAP